MRYHLGLGCSFGMSSHSVHQVIAEKMGARFINLSVGGKGNFRIYTELLQWISANRKILRDTTVSIGWSGIWRNDVIKDAHKFVEGVKFDQAYEWHTWRADRPNKTLRNMPGGMEIDLDHLVRFYMYVIGAQNFLKNLGVDYVMYNSLDPAVPERARHGWKNLRLSVLRSQIDMTRYFRFSECQSQFIARHGYFLDPTPVSFFERIKRLMSKFSQTEMHMDCEVRDAHPSPEGDRKWAELVCNFCNENQLLYPIISK